MICVYIYIYGTHGKPEDKQQEMALSSTTSVLGLELRQSGTAVRAFPYWLSHQPKKNVFKVKRGQKDSKNAYQRTLLFAQLNCAFSMETKAFLDTEKCRGFVSERLKRCQRKLEPGARHTREDLKCSRWNNYIGIANTNGSFPVL